MSIAGEISKRRTFAIISHPDAGKTTLTEKFLLFGGAIQTAGAVKSNKITKTATSDFMEIEKQRGISVATSVMGFDYHGVKVNILDTPGHKDFAEDTYRTLTAVDSVILVVDCVKGVETQTEKLMEVCRMRNTPVIIFINKMDRDGKSPFDLLDELEEKLNIKTRPLSWPISMGSTFKGVYNLFDKNLYLFEGAKSKVHDKSIVITDLNDKVLELNHRGHKVDDTRKAIKLLRLAGFKIHGHWMANLYGSTPKEDIEDFAKMFSDRDFRPDELKVYPCSLLDTAELLDYYEKGLWKPYNHQELLDVVAEVIAETPEYCRLTRVIRDIPSTDIVAGNKFTNFREMAEKELDRRGVIKKDIRSREIKQKQVSRQDLELKITSYETSIGTDYFLQFVTKTNQIAGFLRLCLPEYKENEKLTIKNESGFVTGSNVEENTGEKDFKSDQKPELVSAYLGGRGIIHPFLPELSGAAIIREVHVYGKAVAIGDKDDGKAQHLGLGTELLEKAKELSKNAGYQKISVISAIGTKEYYRKKGFSDDGLYQAIVF